MPEDVLWVHFQDQRVNQWWIFRSYARDKIVLDFGCGAGYGANLLSSVSQKVVAFDGDPLVIEYASNKYKSNNLHFQSINPIDYSPVVKFDLITCFQVIEHIKKDELDHFLIKLQTNINQDGIIIISTPNKLIRLLPFQKPWDTEHTREYEPSELEALLKRYFKNIKLLGIKGKKNIQWIEKKRVRKNAILALFRYIVPQWLYTSTKRAKKRAQNITLAKRHSKDIQKWDISYTLDDFELSFPFAQKEALDIIAVCQL